MIKHFIRKGEFEIAANSLQKMEFLIQENEQHCYLKYFNLLTIFL